jgi:hypothetical protein
VRTGSGFWAPRQDSSDGSNAFFTPRLLHLATPSALFPQADDSGSDSMARRSRLVRPLTGRGPHAPGFQGASTLRNNNTTTTSRNHASTTLGRKIRPSRARSSHLVANSCPAICTIPALASAADVLWSLGRRWKLDEFLRLSGKGLVVFALWLLINTFGY